MGQEIWDGEALVVSRTKLSAQLGHATFDQLAYSDSPYRVSRLRLVRDPFAYEVFGYFKAADAIQLAWSLPPATAELDKLKVTAGSYLWVPPVERQLGIGFRNLWLFRVETEDSALDHGEIYNSWAFGLQPADSELRQFVEFPKHPASKARNSLIRTPGLG